MNGSALVRYLRITSSNLSSASGRAIALVVVLAAVPACGEGDVIVEPSEGCGGDISKVVTTADELAQLADAETLPELAICPGQLEGSVEWELPRLVRINGSLHVGAPDTGHLTIRFPRLVAAQRTILGFGYDDPFGTSEGVAVELTSLTSVPYLWVSGKFHRVGMPALQGADSIYFRDALADIDMPSLTDAIHVDVDGGSGAVALPALRVADYVGINRELEQDTLALPSLRLGEISLVALGATREVLLPVLESTEFFGVVASEELVGIEAPNLVHVTELLILSNPKLTTIDAPGLASASELTIRDNASLPQCVADALVAQTTPTEVDVRGNNDSASCP